MSSYKTPGVYIEEINAISGTITAVETAIPAFVGYTKQYPGENKANKDRPYRIQSFNEFNRLFGGAPTIQFSVGDDGTVTPASQMYYLYNSMRLFYANGGGECFVVSVGTYKDNGGVNPNALTGDGEGKGEYEGINALKKEMDVTLLVIPDAMALTDGYTKVQSKMLEHCGDKNREKGMRNRFAILDVPQDTGDSLRTHTENYRKGVTKFLDFGAAYYPWLETNIVAAKEVNQDNIKNLDVFKTYLIGKNSELKTEIDKLDETTSIKTPAPDDLDTKIGNTFDTPLNTRTLTYIADELDFQLNTADSLKLKVYKLVDDIVNPKKEAAIIANNDKLTASAASLSIANLPDSVDKSSDSGTFNGLDSNIANRLKNLLGAKSIKEEDLIDAYGDSENNKDIRVLAIINEETIIRKITDQAGTDKLDDASDKLYGIDYTDLNNELGKTTKTAPVYKRIRVAQLLGVPGSDKMVDPAIDQKRVHNTLYTQVPEYKAVIDEIRNQLNVLPPSAAMAGIYTYSDNNFNVGRAPANFGLDAVIQPQVKISNLEQQDMNMPMDGKAINAIRAFRGRGNLVWGARTLDGNSGDWRYINVRRSVIMIEESIRRALDAYVFRPNVQATWLDVQSQITAFLTDVWKQGILMGDTPDQAFQVAVGLGTTMTPMDVIDGYMRISVKICVARPAEFIVVTFEQMMPAG